MMTIEEMRERKKDLAYTYEYIAERSGLPLSTVQKVLCGVSKAPRRKTLEALEMVLKKPSYYADPPERFGASFAKEEAASYESFSGAVRIPAKRKDYWAIPEPSDKWPRQGEYTVEDIDALPDDVRVELIDGYIYDMSAPSKAHQRTMGYLYIDLDRCISEHECPCEVFMAPDAFHPDEDNKTELQPDIQIICLDRNEGINVKPVPRMVIEVLSPSTREKDCTTKLRKYMNSTISEYWIVDLQNKKVMVYLFDEDPLPTQYSFDDIIPVGISDGKCSIDFGSINTRLKEASSIFGDEW